MILPFKGFHINTAEIWQQYTTN